MEKQTLRDFWNQEEMSQYQKNSTHFELWLNYNLRTQITDAVVKDPATERVRIKIPKIYDTPLCEKRLEEWGKDEGLWITSAHRPLFNTGKYNYYSVYRSKVWPNAYKNKEQETTDDVRVENT